MADEDVDQGVASLGLLADPTRRALFDAVAGSADPLSRDQAAAVVGVSRTLAAYHLDLLADAGLLEVEYRRLTGRRGPGAGRPAKLYRRSPTEVSVTIPERRYVVAAQVLAEALERLPSATAEAPVVDAARRMGERLAAEGHEADDETLLRSLGQAGYEPVVVDGEVRLRNCPYHLLAEDHRDLVCGINREMLDALVGRLGMSDREAVLDPRPGWCCVAIRRRT